MQKWAILGVVAFVVFAIDQLAKAWIVAHMVIGQTIEVIPPLAPYLQITRTTNTGIAFGIFKGGNTLLLVLTTLVVIALIVIYRSLPPAERWQQIGYAVIIGAALGNILDRVRFGHVVDFVHVYIPNLISNVSNFADHFVIIGVIIILIDSFRAEAAERQKNTPVAVPPDDVSPTEQLPAE